MFNIFSIFAQNIASMCVDIIAEVVLMSMHNLFLIKYN